MHWKLVHLIIYIDFTHIATSNTAAEDVTN